MDRILVCQPMGGFNDTLCQIGLSIRYATKYKRKLIIDTNMVSDFNDHFSNYFQLQQPEDFIELKPNIDLGFYCSKTNPEVNRIDLDVSYDDDIILHRSFGGGFDSLVTLRYFKLTDELSYRVKTKLEQLGSYHAVMIRNTDYNTDYQQELTDIEKLNINVPLVLTTDDVKVQEYAKSLNFHKLILNNNLLKNDDPNESIMQMCRRFKSITPKSVNDEVIMDLFLAANAEHIYPTRVVGRYNNREFANENFRSGFINLAMYLNNNRDLLKRVIG